MLPEALSNGLCSLRPDEERPCLAVHMWLDRDGGLQRHRFTRGLMRSAARLTYSQVQDAKNGHGDAAATPILDTAINLLYGAFAVLSKAREKRGVLDLNLPERRVTLDESGNLTGIETHNRLDSHRLIEEFMITANVAAAETLSRCKRPCMYRVHEPPNPSKVEALRNFLKSFGYSLPPGRVILPRNFSHILHQASASDHASLISEIILRTQSKAVYSPKNLGHFGLALGQYAHFTSPIRRYSDILVHRSLIDALKLGEHGLSSNSIERFNDIASHISTTERRAEAAERDAFDRYAVSFLSDRVGEKFSGRINGVTRFGLFITLDEIGADGLVPMRSLGTEFFDHDEAHHCLCGRATGKTFTLGGLVIVRLIEANLVTGSMKFEILEGGSEGKPTPVTSGKKKRTTKRRGASASVRQKRKGGK
jgi:ribonuclease R